MVSNGRLDGLNGEAGSRARTTAGRTDDPEPLTGFPPKSFIIGAQKAGTTFLASLLAQHPSIELARPKEPAFFTRHWERGLEWYRTCFARNENAVLLDATPSYTFAHVGARTRMALDDRPRGGRFGDVPRRIHEVSPDARFIYVMRDPVERIHSAYWHMVRLGEEKKEFRAAIETDGSYINASRYLGQIEEYMRFFGRHRFLFLLFDDLKNDPTETSRECFRFLGVNPELDVRPSGGRHRGYRPSAAGRLLQASVRAPWLGGLAAGLSARMPDRFREGVRTMLLRPIPPLTDRDRAWLEEYVAGELPELRELTKLSLERWPSYPAQ